MKELQCEFSYFQDSIKTRHQWRHIIVMVSIRKCLIEKGALPFWDTWCEERTSWRGYESPSGCPSARVWRCGAAEARLGAVSCYWLEVTGTAVVHSSSACCVQIPSVQGSYLHGACLEHTAYINPDGNDVIGLRIEAKQIHYTIQGYY